MGALSLRLPDDLEDALTDEAKREHKPRSAVLRQALVDYLHRMEKERFMNSMVEAATALANHPDARKESLEIVESTLIDTGNAMRDGEDPETHDPWWK